MSGHWQDQREGGARFSISFMIKTALRCGRPVFQIFLYPTALYFFLRRGAERRASRAYLTRIFGRPALWWEVLKHVHCFSVTLADRIFLLAHGERDFQVEVTGVELLQQRIAEGRGVLLVGSHQGSFEVLRALSARCPDVPLRVLLDKQKTPAMTELFESLAPEIGEAVIDVSQGGACIALAVAEACSKGGMVALLADRGRAHEVLRKVDFLGSSAPFPVGPWLLANTLQVPVMLCFGIYLGGSRYALSFESFADRVDIPRNGRYLALDGILRRYAERLEHYARSYPYNWFNFYDFWQQQSDAQSVALVTDTVREA